MGTPQMRTCAETILKCSPRRPDVCFVHAPRTASELTGLSEMNASGPTSPRLALPRYRPLKDLKAGMAAQAIVVKRLVGSRPEPRVFEALHAALVVPHNPVVVL